MRIILALAISGVLLAVSSKNDEEQARRPFREIPDMVLKEESFSAFYANWSDKAANIEAIAQELSLGLNALASGVVRTYAHLRFAQSVRRIFEWRPQDASGLRI